jgi:type 1 glutamine amidotransferase
MIQTLIVDGQNNHDWTATTPILRKILEDTGRFTVSVCTSPPKDAPAEAWRGFEPSFELYQVIVLNYTDIGGGTFWPKDRVGSLVRFVKDGGGLVVYHAAASAFTEHEGFNRLIGLGWRGADFGYRLYGDEAGAIRRVPPGTGPGAGHGPRRRFTIRHIQPEHPILAGLPETWTHAQDELWFGQRGPARSEMSVLADAYCEETGVYEPLLWTNTDGPGRVFVTLLGHDAEAMDCPGFRTTLGRGAQWAAWREVDLPAPPAEALA